MGPDETLVSLYEEHAARLYTYCLRVTSSPEDAADALQDTFIAVYRRLSSSDEAIEHPRAYLFATARNACLRRVDDRRRVTVVSEPPEPAHAGELPEAERDVLTSDLQEEVRAANARLPVRQREILVLRELEELSYDDIGALMDLQPNAAAQLAWRARLSLRTALRRGALSSIAPASEACARAMTLLALSEDGPLPEADEDRLYDHLSECGRCRANRTAMLEAGTTYRSWAPAAAAPIAAELMLENAHAAMGSSQGVVRPPQTRLLFGSLLVWLVVGATVVTDEVVDGAPPPAAGNAATAPASPSGTPAGAPAEEQVSSARTRARARGGGGGAEEGSASGETTETTGESVAASAETPPSGGDDDTGPPPRAGDEDTPPGPPTGGGTPAGDAAPAGPPAPLEAASLEAPRPPPPPGPPPAPDVFTETLIETTMRTTTTTTTTFEAAPPTEDEVPEQPPPTPPGRPIFPSFPDSDEGPPDERPSGTDRPTR